MIKPTSTDSTKGLADDAPPVRSSQASLVGSTSVRPSATGEQGASTQFIIIDKVKVKRNYKHFPGYSLSFTLHRDSEFDGNWWEDVPVWKSLSALSILTAQAYSYQKTLTDERRRLTEVRKTTAKDGSKSVADFIPLGEDLYNDDWKAFVNERLEDPTFNVNGVRIEKRSSWKFLADLIRRIRPSHHQTKLDPAFSVETYFADDEAGHLCIALTKVNTVVRDEKNLPHRYKFCAQVSEKLPNYKHFQILRTMKIKDGPSIDLVDITRRSKSGSEDNDSDELESSTERS